MKLILGLIFTLISTSVFADDLATEKQLSAAYVDLMKTEEGAYTIANGTVIRPIFTSQNKVKPTGASTIVALYEGFDREGKVFDSAFQREEPATFPLSAVIPCWEQGVQEMTVGSVYKITCPSDTAYGDTGRPPAIKPGAALTFRVILLEIQ